MKVYAVNTDEIVGHLLALDDEGYSKLILKVNKERKEAELKQHIGCVYMRDMKGTILYLVPREIVDGVLVRCQYRFDLTELNIREAVTIHNISIWTPVAGYVLASKILRVIDDNVSLVPGR